MATRGFKSPPGKPTVSCTSILKMSREAWGPGAAQAAAGPAPPLGELGLQSGSSLFVPLPVRAEPSPERRHREHESLCSPSGSVWLLRFSRLGCVLTSTPPLPSFSNLESRNTDSACSLSSHLTCVFGNAVLASLGFSCMKSSLPALKTEHDISSGT